MWARLAAQGSPLRATDRLPSPSLPSAHRLARAQAICQLLLEVRDYFEAAVAALEGAPAPEGAAPPALRAAPDLDRFLNAQLAGAGARAGRAPQAQLEAPLAELEAAVPGLAKTHLARHLT